MTWNLYTQRIAEALGAPTPQIVHIPTDMLFQAAPQRYAVVKENFQFNNIFDNAAARADLNFRYTIPWLTGVRRMAAWLDEHQRIENSDLDPFEDDLVARWQALRMQD